MPPPLPERPHFAPCDCAECVLWASTIVAIPTTRKRPDPKAVTASRTEMPLAEFSRHLIAIASKVTGMAEAELRAKGELMSNEKKPARPSARADRETVAARGVPELHLSAIYDSRPIDCDALKAVQSFLAGTRTVLCLSGGVGLRKTGSACWALSEKPGRYVKASRLAALATSPLDDERAAYSLLFRCQVMVLDDLGGEYRDEKGWFVKMLGELLDARYEAKLKTIITTNLGSDEFKTTYNDRITDRVRECGIWINLGGVSVR